MWGEDRDVPEVRRKPSGIFESVRYLFERARRPSFEMQLNFLVSDLAYYLNDGNDDIEESVPGFIDALRRMEYTYSGHADTVRILNRNINRLSPF